MSDSVSPAPRLLIVDDLIANREVLARRFELRGYHSVTADGGLRALELIEESAFDVVLLDVMMPDMDGREVLRRIRETHSASELPVIMVTARTESADVVEALALGANDYLTKPVDFAVAWARVDAQIGRKRAEEEARRSEARLRASHKLEAVGQLAGGIAHDFNNLLLVIDGFTRMALASKDDPDAVAEALGEVLQATETAESLISKLSVFSRRELVDRRVVRLADALEDLEGLLRPLLGPRQPLVLDIGEAARELCVETDLAEFRHAIVNLVINARDAMPDGGGVVLGLSLAEEPALAEIRVRDTGQGIDEATLTRIFEPFFTTKTQGEGSGLGLAMVYGFAQQSGGSITAESRVGEGSTFRLRLPTVDREPVADVPGPQAAPQGRGQTVLVVEDDEQLMRLTRSTLEGLGYRVLCAGNGLEALEVHAEHGETIALVLSDVVMPSVGGFELGRILHRARPGLPVVLMSGYPTRGDLKSVSIPPGAAFLAKPFKPTDLAKMVAERLSGVRHLTSGEALDDAA